MSCVERVQHYVVLPGEDAPVDPAVASAGLPAVRTTPPRTPATRHALSLRGTRSSSSPSSSLSSAQHVLPLLCWERERGKNVALELPEWGSVGTLRQFFFALARA